MRLVPLLVLALVAPSCVANPATVPSASPIPTAQPTPSATPAPTPAPTATPDCATRVFASLSEPQRIGQLFLLGLANDQLGADEIAAIRTRHIGSVWFVEQSHDGVAAIRAVANAVQTLVASDTTGGIRFFVAANQEGGVIQSLSGPGFTTIPSAYDQRTLDPLVLRARAAQWGRELVAAGVNLNFAPVLDVVPAGTEADNAPIGALKRGYGSDSAAVSSHALAFMDGMEDAGVATTGKHFPGLGRVKGNTDFTASVVDSVTAPDDPYLVPFRDAAAHGIPLMMVALATYEKIDPTQLAVFSPIVMARLRGPLAYNNGVIVSDDLGETVAVANIAPADRATRFIAAGGDMIISKTVAPAIAMADALAARAASDAAFKMRIDDAALRVIRLKVARGLASC